MSIEARRSNIQHHIEKAGQLSYESLAAAFGVSEMTIRRDIEALEDTGVVRRVLGGAISASSSSDEPSFESRLIHAANQKSHIADAVVKLLEPNESVLLDGGSTVLAIARHIKNKQLGLTVITLSVLAGLELIDEPNTTIFLVGGRLRPGELSVIGTEVDEGIRKYNCDTYIAGVAGIHSTKGLSDYNSDESGVKSSAIHSARRVIIPVDSSKLGKVSLVNVAPLSAASVIVTDGPYSHPVLKAARKLGIEIVTC